MACSGEAKADEGTPLLVELIVKQRREGWQDGSERGEKKARSQDR